MGICQSFFSGREKHEHPGEHPGHEVDDHHAGEHLDQVEIVGLLGHGGSTIKKIERDSGVVSIATRLRAISFRSRRARRRAAPRYEDDRPDEEFTAGQTYFVGPGHIPKILGDKTCIMVEFAESANKIYENIDKSD